MHRRLLKWCFMDFTRQPHNWHFWLKIRNFSLEQSYHQKQIKYLMAIGHRPRDLQRAVGVGLVPVHCILLGGRVLAVVRLAEDDNLPLAPLGVCIHLVASEVVAELELQSTVPTLRANRSNKV